MNALLHTLISTAITKFQVMISRNFFRNLQNKQNKDSSVEFEHCLLSVFNLASVMKKQHSVVLLR
jgi:hypothetical protein